MATKKDHYFYIPATPEAGYVVVGSRLVWVPANESRVYSYAAGPDYGKLVWSSAVDQGLVCDCITSGNTLKPKQHGADPHAKNCAVYTRRENQ